MQLESPCRFSVCPPQLVALHQVLKAVVFDTSQSRRRAACLMPSKDVRQATGSLHAACTQPALATQVPSVVTGSTFSSWLPCFQAHQCWDSACQLSLPLHGSGVQGLPPVVLRKALRGMHLTALAGQELCPRVGALVGHLTLESRCQAKMAQHFPWPSVTV